MPRFRTASIVVAACLVAGSVLAATALPPLPRDDVEIAHWTNYAKERGTRQVKRVVMHTVEGSAQSAINFFQSPYAGASAHYVVSKTGHITQTVYDNDRAFHVRWNNTDTIGIEHEGWASQNGWTDEMLRASARITHYLSKKYGFDVNARTVLSHQSLDPTHRRDPGPYFPWSLYLSWAKFGPDNLASRARIAADLADKRGLADVRPARPSFKDLSATHLVYARVEAAKQAGLVSGYGNGTFHPLRPLSRGEAYRLFYKAQGGPAGAAPQRPDDPILQADWAALLTTFKPAVAPASAPTTTTPSAAPPAPATPAPSDPSATGVIPRLKAVTAR